MISKRMYAFTLLALVFVVASAKGTILAPGGSALGSGDPVPLLSGTDIATVGPTAYTLSGGAGTGLWEEQVWTDPSNVFCAGCLDFFFQVAVTSGTIGRVTAFDYTGFLTDVGFNSVGVYESPLPTNPTVVAQAVNRSSDGSTIGWDFTTLNVGAGEDTQELAIETNATTIKPGQFNLIDHGVYFATDIAPASAVPEPGTMTLFGSGLIGLAGLLRRKLALL